MGQIEYSFTWLTELPEKLEQLRGLDYEACAERVRKKGNTAILLKADESFQAELAAAALGVNVNDIKALPLRQYSQLIQIVFNFLFSTDSETPENSAA